MKKEEFDTKILELLPGASRSALSSYMDYAHSLEEDGTEQAATFYDWFYVDASLVVRDYGVDVATALFNYGEHFTFNPFELRGAARLLNEGWALEQIEEKVLEDGCDATAQEVDESAKELKKFKESLLHDGGAESKQPVETKPLQNSKSRIQYQQKM